jgi:CheY-like chemotaxis protein
MTENHSIVPQPTARKETEAATILLVDDAPINLNVLFQALEGNDYRLLAARSGEEALSRSISGWDVRPVYAMT